MNHSKSSVNLLAPQSFASPNLGMIPIRPQEELYKSLIDFELTRWVIANILFLSLAYDWKLGLACDVM